MYIKQITIQGFKSYKDQTTIEPFNPKHNVIVGRNGSGKSNFFSAIRFVLGDAYTTLNKEERQALLHEGVGAATISAYVEIVFDNADHKFPIDKPEVTLRRSIGLSLDEYSLDGKSITKSDVKNLFESAGLSSANPYYVVPQGRINSLTTAKDKDRLELLKDIAGTSTYEEKRKESNKIMQETDDKRSKITELLDFIQERLSQLEEEKEELSQFQNLDAERRALEYTIFMREQMDTNNKLDELNTSRQNDLQVRDLKRDEYNDNETSIMALEDQRRDLKQSIQIKDMEKVELQDELDDLMKLRTQLELQIKDLEDGQLSENEYKKKMNDQLELINQEIQNKENELNTIHPQYQTLIQTDQSLREQMDGFKAEMNHLYAKQARLSQHASREDRDRWLQGQINELNALYTNLQEQLTTIDDEKDSLNEILLQKTQSMEDIQDKLMERRKAKEDVMTQTIDLKLQRDQWTEDRKTLWREEAGLDALLQNGKDEIHKAERILSASMDKNTNIGLNAIQRIIKEHKLQGVCGPLYELFDVDDRFKTAVEVAAGASLFHVVVENDDIATHLLDAMSHERAGRVTFVPLNRIKDINSSIEYPSANDAIPLISKLNFDPKYQRVFEQIFSRIIVCPNLEIAASYAKTQGFTVVTLNGDRVDGRGAFFGGFTNISHHHSRIEAAKNLKQQRLNLEKNQHRRVEIKQEVEVLNQKVTKVLSDLQILETKNKKWQIQVDPSDQIAKLRKEEDYYKQLIEEKEKSLNDIKKSIESVSFQINNYQNELQTEPTNSLSPEEQAIVARNRTSIEEIRQQLLASSESKLKMETQINDIKAVLDNDLKRKRDDLISKRDRINDVNVVKNDLNQRNKEHKAVVRRLGRLVKRITELENEIDNDQDRVQKYKENVDELTGIQMALETEVVKLEKHLERHLYRRSILQQKKEECNANIRDLGVLPEEAFDKYVGFSIEKLLRRLHRANESLKKYGHVNKKAVEQYNRFTKQKDQLITRKAELDNSAQSIRRLVETLDRRKNDSIERTFEEVATNFATVFQTLVPVGHGELIMNQQTPIPEGDGMDIDDNNNAVNDVDRYTGISIKVSFNSQVDEGILMQQLSGGQKSLVALALIFAIQKCDPAPFYLFDEIDANLDTQYRTAVANMIHNLATEHNQQFITTTFRAELLNNADQFYGVTFQNKVSRIHVIDKEYALGFVEEEDQAH